MGTPSLEHLIYDDSGLKKSGQVGMSLAYTKSYILPTIDKSGV